MPELSYPTLTVRTEYPGAAPEEVENDISRPIEEALGVVGGLTPDLVEHQPCRGQRRRPRVRLGHVDMSEALQDTLEKLDLVFLPDEAERPLILRFDPSLDPVMELSSRAAAIASRARREPAPVAPNRRDLQVRRALEPIRGVAAAVRLRGGLEEEIHVLVDDEQLRRTGMLDPARDRPLAPGERQRRRRHLIQEGRTEYMVRTLNEFESLRADPRHGGRQRSTGATSV